MNISTDNYIIIGLILVLVFLTYYNLDNFGNCNENNKLAQKEIDNYNNRSLNIEDTNDFFTTLFLPQKFSCCKKSLGQSVTDNDRLSCNCPDK
jgi:hypothetical protein